MLVAHCKFSVNQKIKSSVSGVKSRGIEAEGKTALTIKEVKHGMKGSNYKSYEELPLFLNAATVAKVLGVSPSSGYELMHEPGFPVLKVGNRMVVPKEKFIQWVEQHTSGSVD